MPKIPCGDPHWCTVRRTSQTAAPWCDQLIILQEPNGEVAPSHCILWEHRLQYAWGYSGSRCFSTTACGRVYARVMCVRDHIWMRGEKERNHGIHTRGAFTMLWVVHLVYVVARGHLVRHIVAQGTALVAHERHSDAARWQRKQHTCPPTAATHCCSVAAHTHTGKP